MTHPALAQPPLGFAHRGFTPPAPGRAAHAWENTLAAFDAAVALGLRHVETDCHLTADGVVVLVHDPDLGRTTDRTGAVRDLRWAEVARARTPGGQRVPRLDQVLAELPDVVLNIDCKDPRAVLPLARTLREAGAEHRVVVAAFDGRRSLAVQRAAPGVARSLGISGTAAVRLATAVRATGSGPGRALFRRVTSGAQALQVPERARGIRVVTPRLLALGHDLGLQVHVWTVDDATEMHRLFDLGVDGVMSDRADILARVLQDRAG